MVATEVLELLQAPLHLAGLDLLLYPRASSLFGPVWYPTGSTLDRGAHMLTATLRVGAVMAPVVIEGYAFYRLFRTFGARDIIVWLDMALSLGFIAFAAVLYLVSLRTTEFAGDALDPGHSAHLIGSGEMDHRAEKGS